MGNFGVLLLDSISYHHQHYLLKDVPETCRLHAVAHRICSGRSVGQHLTKTLAFPLYHPSPVSAYTHSMDIGVIHLRVLVESFSCTSASWSSSLISLVIINHVCLWSSSNAETLWSSSSTFSITSTTPFVRTSPELHRINSGRLHSYSWML